jgi:hypothetical protein
MRFQKYCIDLNMEALRMDHTAIPGEIYFIKWLLSYFCILMSVIITAMLFFFQIQFLLIFCLYEGHKVINLNP